MVIEKFVQTTQWIREDKKKGGVSHVFVEFAFRFCD